VQQEIEEKIKSIKEFFELRKEVFDDKILPALEFMQNRDSTIDANFVTFWRNPESKNLSLVISKIENDEEEVYESKFNCELISDWDSVFSARDLYQFYELHGESTQLEIRIEKEFLLWFIENWYRINGHKIKDTNQKIIENSSARGFDLNAMNYDEVVEGESRLNYKYNHKLSKHELEQRLKVYEVIENYTTDYHRILATPQNFVELKYSNSKLTHQNLPSELVELVELANKAPNKYFTLRYMTKIIDKLIELNYVEK